MLKVVKITYSSIFWTYPEKNKSYFESTAQSCMKSPVWSARLTLWIPFCLNFFRIFQIKEKATRELWFPLHSFHVSHLICIRMSIEN